MCHMPLPGEGTTRIKRCQSIWSHHTPRSMRIRWAMVHCGGMGSPNIYNTREADVSKSPTCQSAFAGNSSAGKASAVLPFTHFSRVLNPLIFVRNFGYKLKAFESIAALSNLRRKIRMFI